MPYAITQSCCSDASCVSVCPVNCIHPTPDEPDFATAEMLYVDPRACIDCGACADACPVEAIFPVDSLFGADTAYAAINAEHYDTDPARAEAGRADRTEVRTDAWGDPRFPTSLAPHAARLRVAVVGTGPAAGYTAAALLSTSAEVTMLERLPVPGGLVRFGVAPDHTSTKAIADRFATVQRNPRLRMLLNVEVGRDVSHTDLLRHHDAVVYATGASADRTLGVPGEGLPGSLSARTFVGWYNAHPEIDGDLVDLSAVRDGRVVVVGNGNVALDVARILLTDPTALVSTDIAGHALEALRHSNVREVVLVARRGPGDAAYTLAELRDLISREDLDVVVDGGPDLARELVGTAVGDKAAALRDLPVVPVDWSIPAGPRKRLVLRFASVVRRVVGTAGDDGVQAVAAVELVATAAAGGGPGSDSGPTRIPAGLLLRSVGYRSEPLPGLPFDPEAHVVPHEAGRVVDPVDGRVVPGVYVVGWAKRGPSGGIGSNRVDAAETVASLVADANASVITAGRGSWWSLRRLVHRRRPTVIARRHAERIDRAECAAGAEQGRPRVKLATLEGLLDAARSPRQRARRATPRRTTAQGSGAMP